MWQYSLWDWLCEYCGRTVSPFDKRDPSDTWLRSRLWVSSPPRFCGKPCAKGQWYLDNRDKVRDSNRRRRARKRQNPSEIIIDAVVIERDAGRCQICQEPIENHPWPHPRSPSLDHIVPLVRGGSHTYDNVQLTHLVCNLRKGAAV